MKISSIGFTFRKYFILCVGLGWLLSCQTAVAQTNGMAAQIPASEYDALVDLYISTDGTNWTANGGWLDAQAQFWLDVGVSGVQMDTNGNVIAKGHVTELILGFNNLTGSITNTLENLSQLKYLNLSLNNLTGNIPSSFGNLSTVQGIVLSFNALEGSVSSSLGSLSQLTNLDLSFNYLSSSIPSSLGSLSQLRSLWLQDNELSGTIPSNLGNLSSLKALVLYENNLTSVVPYFSNFHSSTINVRNNQRGFKKASKPVGQRR